MLVNPDISKTCFTFWLSPARAISPEIFLNCFAAVRRTRQSRAADIFKFTTFDEHLRLLFFKQFCKYLFKFGGRCDIESAFKGYNSNVVYFFLANFHI